MIDTLVSLLTRWRVRRAVGAMLVGALTLLVRPAIAQAQQYQLQQLQMLARSGGMPINTAYAMGPKGQIQIAVGVQGADAVLPMGPNGLTYSKQFGLQLSINSAWPGQYGYRPIEVKFLADKPATRDLKISFKFSAGDYRSSGSGMTVEESTTLKQGETTAAIQLIVPQLESWQQAHWEVTVNGQRDDDLAVSYLDFHSAVGRTPPGMGIVGTMFDGRQWSRVSSELQNAFNGNSVSSQNVVAADLPTDWLEYTMLDIVVLPADKLEELLTKHPAQATAIMRWVATGGNLWLVDAGRSWQEMPAVEAALATFALPAERREDANAAVEEVELTLGELPATWRYAPLGNRATEAGEGALILSGFPIAPGPTLSTPSTPQDPLGAAPSAGSATTSPSTGTRRGRRYAQNQMLPNGAIAIDSNDWFAVRGWGLGAITAFRQDFDGRAARTDQMYQAMSQSLVGSRLQWPNRFGNHPDNTNGDFNNWLIPNVGVAPVGQFQFLITIFVLVIGPLNYWLLKRSNRLPMLLATVPAAALITTLLLFAYGMLADGFSVRMRGRSVTLLDQQASEAVSFGRLSYYAGIAPRNGLAVPVDQAMYPINPNWRPNFGYGGGNYSAAQREVVWNDKQRLTRGWLASRTPTQFHAVAARPSKKRLDLRPSPEGMRVVNRLDTDVSLLAIHAKDGKFYFCETLAKDEGRLLTAVDQSELSSRVRRRFTDNIPETPGGDDASWRSAAYGFPLAMSVMEGRLEAINSPAVSGWGPGRYIAFTATAIELDSGLAAIDEEASFHVVEGSW